MQINLVGFPQKSRQSKSKCTLNFSTYLRRCQITKSWISRFDWSLLPNRTIFAMNIDFTIWIISTSWSSAFTIRIITRSWLWNFMTLINSAWSTTKKQKTSSSYYIMFVTIQQTINDERCKKRKDIKIILKEVFTFK